MVDLRARVASRTGLVRAWSEKGKTTLAGSRGLWSGFRREGSRSVKEVHSLSMGTAIAMAIYSQYNPPKRDDWGWGGRGGGYH